MSAGGVKTAITNSKLCSPSSMRAMLSARNAEQDSVRSSASLLGGLDDPFDNLVVKALGKLPRAEGLAMLEKNLPVAAGLGAGSADAGAVFRIVRERFGLPDDWHGACRRARRGCSGQAESRTCIGRGTGARTGGRQPGRNPTLLVNPRPPLSTGPVFQAWDGADRGPMPQGDARAIALEGRNDLESPAIELCPEIAEVLAAMRWNFAVSRPYVRFGRDLFCAIRERNSAARPRHAAADHSGWWQMQGPAK